MLVDVWVAWTSKDGVGVNSGAGRADSPSCVGGGPTIPSAVIQYGALLSLFFTRRSSCSLQVTGVAVAGLGIVGAGVRVGVRVAVCVGM